MSIDADICYRSIPEKDFSDKDPTFDDLQDYLDSLVVHYELDEEIIDYSVPIKPMDLNTDTDIPF